MVLMPKRKKHRNSLDIYNKTAPKKTIKAPLELE